MGTGDFSLFCCFLIYFGMDSLVPLMLLLRLSPFTFLSAVYLSHVCLTFFLTFCLFVWSSKLLASCLHEQFIVRTLTHFGLHCTRSFVYRQHTWSSTGVGCLLQSKMVQSFGFSSYSFNTKRLPWREVCVLTLWWNPFAGSWAYSVCC